jgi:hypothetical protein
MIATDSTEHGFVEIELKPLIIEIDVLMDSTPGTARDGRHQNCD